MWLESLTITGVISGLIVLGKISKMILESGLLKCDKKKIKESKEF